MKKTVLKVISGLCLSSVMMNAQNRIPCATDEMKNHYIKTIPGYKEKIEASQIESNQHLQTYLANKQLNRASSVAQVTYTIPMVFHILHVGGPENISDASVIAAVAQLNKDYARKNPDTTQIDPLYEPLYVNSGIHFELAKKDPNGNCTTGIIHHYDTNTDWAEGATFNCIYTGNQAGRWKPSKYLNVYVVRNISGEIAGGGFGIGGYTFKPGTAPNTSSDAVIISLGNFANSTKTEAHEIGHWFGLSHTFDGNNGFNQATNIGYRCGDDGIADTPKTPGFVNGCPSYLTLLDSCDPGKRPNIQNIMDYANCPKMFTQGQTDVMRFSAQSVAGDRNNLSSTQNLIDVGILNPSTVPCGPVADFAANKFNTCAGQSIIFNNTSYNSTPTSFLWAFEGGTPATSTLASQTVTYSTPGTYSVSLTVSNANGISNTKISTNYINTSWNTDPTAYPYYEGFETGYLPNAWAIKNNEFGSIQWEPANYGSLNSQKSFYLNNSSGYFDGDIDVLETPQFNFKNTSNVSISFDYSGAREQNILKGLTSLKFQYSLDCGGTWTNLIGGVPNDSVIAKNTGGIITGPYVPISSTKWATKVYTPILIGSTFSNRQDVKFRFLFTNKYTGLKNIYIDNFNISATVGLNELENNIGLSMYPNPTNTSSTLEFLTQANTSVEVIVCDITGRLVESKIIKAIGAETTKYTVNEQSNLNSGIYFVTLSINNQKITKKLMID